MKDEQFLHTLNEARLVRAIQDAEERTSGEVRVCVTRTPEPDAFAAARLAFVKLGMQQTRQRNSVLILVAPRSQTMAVVGDDAIHQLCGDEFWSGIIQELQRAFAQGRMEDGLEAAIARVGEALATHFPREPGDINELPDSIADA